MPIQYLHNFVDGQNTIGTQIVCFGWPFFLFQLGDWDLCRRSLFIEREVEKEKRCHSFLLKKIRLAAGVASHNRCLHFVKFAADFDA